MPSCVYFDYFLGEWETWWRRDIGARPSIYAERQSKTLKIMTWYHYHFARISFDEPHEFPDDGLLLIYFMWFLLRILSFRFSMRWFLIDYIEDRYKLAFDATASRLPGLGHVDESAAGGTTWQKCHLVTYAWQYRPRSVSTSSKLHQNDKLYFHHDMLRLTASYESFSIFLCYFI